MGRLKRNIFRRLLIVLSPVVSGCNSSPAASAPRQIVADMAISVVNRSGSNRAIVLEANAREYTLGVVGPGETKMFSVPSDAGKTLVGLRLKTSGRSRDSFQSDPFRLNPGDRYVWVVSRSGESARR